MGNGEVSRSVHCGHCGARLPKEWAAQAEREQPPCPSCGSQSVNAASKVVDKPRTTDRGREVRNETRLADWLRDRSPQEGVVVAVRAALRCMWAPICESGDPERLSLIAYRVCLLGVIAASEMRESMAPSPTLVQVCAETQNYDGEVLALCRALIRVLLSVERGSSEQSQAFADVARCAADIVSWPGDAEDSWDELNLDVQTLGEGTMTTVMESRLFSQNASKYVLDEVTHSNSRYREHGLEFMADWYETIVNGHVQDVGLLREIAGLPERDWAQGVEHVGAMISGIEMGRRLRDATPLAEEIVFDDRLGKLRVEPIRMVPVDLYETGLEKLRDAVSDARRASERSNSYTVLDPTLGILERTLSTYAGNAQRVHDDQLLASKRILQLIDDGYVPEDHEVVSLLQVLNTNAVDIRAAVPEVALAVKKRSEVRIRELDAEDRDRIQSTIEAIALNSEESLAQELREDERATFRNEDVQVNVESSYRITSRLARVAKMVREWEEIANFADKYGPMISSLGTDLVKSLQKFIGL